MNCHSALSPSFSARNEAISDAKTADASAERFSRMKAAPPVAGCTREREIISGNDNKPREGNYQPPTSSIPVHTNTNTPPTSLTPNKPDEGQDADVVVVSEPSWH